MKDIAAIAMFVLVIGAAAVTLDSGVALTFMMMALYATLLAQAWNLLGGFGGQFSFGHALFFGSGAYVQAIAQLSGGLNAWLALTLAVGAAALVALGVGALAFRYGLKGSYFALVTLAFAEVLRILASVAPISKPVRSASTSVSQNHAAPACQGRRRSLTRNEATTMRTRLCMPPVCQSWRIPASTIG